MMDERMRGIRCEAVECDEIWTLRGQEGWLIDAFGRTEQRGEETKIAHTKALLSA